MIKNMAQEKVAIYVSLQNLTKVRNGKGEKSECRRL
jgi:hypothetical protein